MIQKNSIVEPTDNCGVLKANVFHVYRGGKGRLGFIGDFLKVSIREILLDSEIKKKSKHRAFLIRTNFHTKKKDGSIIFFKNNSIILLKKRLTPRGKILNGPIISTIKRKKFVSSFSRTV